MTQILFLLNFPAIILTGVIGTPIAAFLQVAEWTDWLLFSISFFFISFQWMIVGYVIDKIIEGLKS
ncbi:MAG: hypothetical protein M3Q99_00480 [Acidobacteriota bacterium]|nr:hypothetical protein [Acidobacteriota bacterium]